MKNLENFKPIRRAKININEISLQEFMIIESLSLLTADKLGWEIFKYVDTENLGSLIISKN